MYVIGIDPGISGAICFFDEGKIDVIEMPSMLQKERKIKNKSMVIRLSTRLNHVYLKLIMIKCALWLAGMLQQCQDEKKRSNQHIPILANLLGGKNCSAIQLQFIL